PRDLGPSLSAAIPNGLTERRGPGTRIRVNQRPVEGRSNERRSMTDDSASAATYGANVSSILDDTQVLMSDRPQALHYEKLSAGIEELAPGLVVLRQMGDIQALTRSHAVRQFGGGPMADALSS